MKYDLGLVHVYTGDGKGKTSASIGLAVRALGHNLRVCYVQFFKFDTGEKRVLSMLPNLRYVQFNVPSDFFKEYSDEEKEKVKQDFIVFWQDVLEATRSEKYDVMILDEVVYAIGMGLAPVSVLTQLIRTKPSRLELIMTGRGYPQEVLDLADYVSDIRLVKHPFEDRRIEARKGIEF